MICLHCNSENFTVKSILFPVDVEGETVQVMSDAFTCDHCGEPLMDSKQMDALRLRSADKYKKRHGLLQSHQIIGIRKRLCMPYGILAYALKITPRQLKQYETFYVQPKEIDDLLREINDIMKKRKINET